MSRRIEVEADGVRATFALIEEWAPKTTALLWDVLPLEDRVFRHGKYSGDACFLYAEDERLARLPANNELAVTSIYQGYIVASLHPERHSVELLFSYGLAEYRGPDGRRYVTPVAEIEGDGAAFYEVLRRRATDGQTTITVRKAE